jgi:hypothetical protein
MDMIQFSVRARFALVLLSCAFFAFPAAARPRHPNVNSLSKNSREIFLTSMEWGDKNWDPQAQLCRAPASIRTDGTATESASARLQMHSSFMVRDSVWYSVGLLLRDKAGDRDRAAQIIRAALKAQYREPGKPWDGTFRRYPDEPEPGNNAARWRAYDPNWREFVGTTFAVILNEYPDRIPADLGPAMMESVNYAVAGEIKEMRLQPSYTNISLMYGFLWNYAAVRGNHPEWVAPSTKWQEDTYKLYKEHDAFWEYNSPTYAGADLFGLALWRDYGSTERMRTIGSEMEAGLWRSIADFYSANLRNISGPYDRSYGMDMQSYVSVTGLWLRTVLDAGKAPLTGFDHPPVDHITDLWFTAPIAVLDTQIPADAMKSFKSLQAEHEVRRPIADQRIATAWIGKDVIYGGEITGHTRGVDGASQFHPVTVHWQAPGRIGWIQLTRCPPIDASADKKGITITADGDVSFRISAPGASSSNARAGEWTLPGLTVHVDADSKTFTAVQHGEFVDVTYKGMTKMIMTFNPEGK